MIVEYEKKILPIVVRALELYLADIWHVWQKWELEILGTAYLLRIAPQ